MLSILIVALTAHHVNCEVVNDVHFKKCSAFFYKEQPPSGFSRQNTAEICQRYQNSYHYATLYSTEFRTPIYSAYRLDNKTCPSGQPNRRNTWFVEPQLSGQVYSKDMGTAGANTSTFKNVQAINTDFRNTNYDRGHLNPNFYQCYDSRTATFTLTNAVPQDPCFNQNIWKEMETTAKNIMTDLCSFPGAKRYFVTGAVPTSKKIPSELDDKEGDKQRKYNRVSVPSVMWTAACCDSSSATNQNDRQTGFSFGYYGENVPDSWVIPGTVSFLQGKLRTMYHLQVLNIFENSCFENSENSKKANVKLSVPLNKKIAETLMDMSKSSESSMLPAKRRLVQTIDKTLDQNSAIVQRDWKFEDADIGMESQRLQVQNARRQLSLYGMAMVLTRPKLELTSSKGNIHSIRLGENKNNMPSSLKSKGNSLESKMAEKFGSKNVFQSFRKKQNPWEHFAKRSHANFQTDIQDDDKAISNNRADWTDSHDRTNTETAIVESTLIDNYVIVPSSSNTLSAMGDRCRDEHPCGLYGESYYWCYTDWSDSWDYCCEDECNFRGNSYQWCHAGSKWAYCSKPYSRITLPGKTCREDHECATHDESYFWCYTDKKKNWEYCCQPWHDCLYYGSPYKWCYTGYKTEQKWQKCHY